MSVKEHECFCKLSAAKACVQCTGEDTSSCYSSPPTATTCPLTTHQYCTTLHTVTLGSNGAKTHDVVFRGCSATDFDDGCQANAMQVDGNSATRETSVTCSKTCSTAGCNNEGTYGFESQQSPQLFYPGDFSYNWKSQDSSAIEMKWMLFQQIMNPHEFDLICWLGLGLIMFWKQLKSLCHQIFVKFRNNS